MIGAILSHAHRLLFPRSILPALERAEDGWIARLAFGRQRVDPHQFEVPFVLAFGPRFARNVDDGVAFTLTLQQMS